MNEQTSHCRRCYASQTTEVDVQSSQQRRLSQSTTSPRALQEYWSLDEAIASRVVFVVVSESDGRTGGGQKPFGSHMHSSKW